tara:strand:- start:8403 stop:8747 length:345 start_codon:yes stop_codon:yes gene_type:complete
MSEQVEKPWGSYTNLMDEPYTKVKKIVIKPGQAPSYQYHFKRSEIWVVVQGIGKCKIDDEVTTHEAGDVIYILKEQKHQFTNVGKSDLIFVEIQLGDYFGEDDIVRLEDKYGRV